MVPYLEGHSLFGYITSETLAPPKEIASSASTSTTPPTTPTMVANLAYALWYQQDKLILSTLISTLSNSLLPYVVGIKTSREVWLTLEQILKKILWEVCNRAVGKGRFPKSRENLVLCSLWNPPVALLC